MLEGPECPLDVLDRFYSADEGPWPPLHLNVKLLESLNAVPAFIQNTVHSMQASTAGIVILDHDRKLKESYASFTGDLVNSHTQFSVGSITKIFTSIMLFQLRDRGLLPRLGLDAAVSEMIPEMWSHFKQGLGLARAQHAPSH